MTLQDIKDGLEKAKNGEIYSITPGVYIASKETMIKEQEGWEEEDPAKDNDFTIYNFWIWGDNAEEGFDDLESLLKYFDWVKDLID